MPEETPWARVDQIGIVVSDLDRAIKHYESLGLGPFKSRKPSYLSRELYGRPVPPDAVLIKVASAQSGPLQLELVEPVAEGTHWMEFLRAKGEGINHLGLFVDDFDIEAAKLLEKGYRIIYKSTFQFPNGALGRAAYFDTDKVGGILIEPIQRSPR